MQAEEVSGGDKEVVREYFNNIRFQQWRKIYGETIEVNRVQMDIRIGHSKIVENVMQMLTDEGPLEGVTAEGWADVDSASEVGHGGVLVPAIIEDDVFENLREDHDQLQSYMGSALPCEGVRSSTIKEALQLWTRVHGGKERKGLTKKMD
ncbi:hypothetical protein RJ639_042873 [Escallonia herrerae]|uniref:Uncharacterized protein n=1 Tax=Escallonia herrerae TaxID=1293975 RepID=A0AA89B377_9ASTE|nr:hypothetical protein RJ639_042873 [Escallonia herrerae]